MKIFYCGVAHEAYNINRGYSFEYNNFYLSLKRYPSAEVRHFPFDDILKIGKSRWNQSLLDSVVKEKPDLVFFFMYSEELDPVILKKIKSLTTTIAWFADDYWRFFNYSKYWPPYFTWVITTYSRAVNWYKRDGFSNIILSEWACNDEIYKPVPNLEKNIDVSFVGQFKPPRAKIIHILGKVGIKVEAFGYKWSNGKVSQEEMISIFSRSKINLNLNSRPSLLSPKVFARIFLKKSINKIKLDPHFINNLKAYWHFQIPHTHARPFELSGCGGFVLSGRSEDITDYYREDREMVFFSSPTELFDKIKYYLSHEEEREKIAEAGYKRTKTEHTYHHRFEAIFKKVGLFSTRL